MFYIPNAKGHMVRLSSLRFSNSMPLGIALFIQINDIWISLLIKPMKLNRRQETIQFTKFIVNHIVSLYIENMDQNKTFKASTCLHFCALDMKCKNIKFHANDMKISHA